MRVIKFLFNRGMIITYLILLQILFIVYSVFYLHSFLGYFYLLVGYTGGIFILYISNRDQEPTYKLPWLFVILILSPMGGIIYLIYGQNRASRFLMKRQYAIIKETNKYVKFDENLLKEIEIQNEQVAGQIKYIQQNSGLPIYKNTKTQFLSGGEEFFLKLVKELKKAKKFIFMEYFIIDNGMMLSTILEVLKEKVEQGVKVILMYDDIGCIYKLPYNFDKKLSKLGIECVKFNKFKPILSSVYNNRDHRKISVIDGKVAFTGGINIADEYINVKKRFGHWKDSGIFIEGEAVKSFTLMFLHMYGISTKNRITDFSPYVEIQYSEKFQDEPGYVLPFQDGPYPVFSDAVGENIYINMLNQAKKYAYITTPYLIADHNFISAVRLAAKRGVDVRIITPHIPDKRLVFMMTRASYRKLMNDGVKIYEYTPGFMHAKNFIVDDEIGVVSTINADYRSFVHHYECGVWLYKTKSIQDIKKDFLTTLEYCEQITQKNYNFGIFKRFVSDVLSIFSPLM